MEELNNHFIAAGLIPPNQVISNTTMQRIGTKGKPNGKDGWYICTSEQIDGASVINCLMGDWSTGSQSQYTNWKKDDKQHVPSEIELAILKAQQDKAKAIIEAEKKERHENASIEATKLWVSLAEHGESSYLEKKKVKNHGARYGHDNHGKFIAVPVYGFDRKIRGLQKVYDNGGKYFTPGTDKKGAFFIIGNESTTIALCEGFATAASVYEATGHQTFVAFDAGNLVHVARAIRERYQHRTVIICADNDQWKGGGNPGIDAAKKAADKYRCKVAFPSFDGLDTSSRPTDFNDLHCLAGLEAVRLAIMGRSSAHRVKLTSGFDLANAANGTKWAIKKYLPLNSTVMLYGGSGSGKSFCALDMALCVATGTDWHGNQTMQSPVVYVIGEGAGTMGERINAWCIINQIDITPETPIYFTESAVLLPNDENLDDLMKAVDSLAIESKPGVICFDTLARCFVGDENTAKDAGAFIQELDRLRVTYDCCILTVHHSGKDTGRGARGSSAFKAAMDVEFHLEADEKYKKLTTTKAKGTKEPPPMTFTLDNVDTGKIDEDGDFIFSAALVFVGGDNEDNETKAYMRKVDLMKIISHEYEVGKCKTTTLIRNGDKSLPDYYILKDRIKDAFYDAIHDVKDKSKRSILSKTLKSLISGGKIKVISDKAEDKEYIFITH